MEWVILLVIIIFIASKLTKKASKSPKSEHEGNEIDGSSIRITISGPGYSREVSKKPDDYKWIPPGGAVDVLGYKIHNGMIYVGKHLKSVSSEYSIEPGFINTALPVDRPNPDREGRNLNYWPSYSDLPPSSRAAYLEWQAGGRIDPNVNIGYVFLFFYGLERRLLHDAQKGAVSRDEIQRIFDELKMLRHTYGPKSSSFNHYVNAFLEFMELKHVQSKFYELTPPLSQYTYEMSPIIKLALGQLAKEEKPLSAIWMYHYVLQHFGIGLRTPARRCQEEFKKLFIIRYKKKFNEGIIIKPNKTNIKVEYHCASAGFRGRPRQKTWHIPDVSRLKSLLNKIIPIVEECQDDLDKYSRWIKLHPEEKESLMASSLLPDELADSTGNEELKNFKDWISTHMNDAGSAIVENKELIGKWPVKTPGKMSKSETISFISLLEKIGFSIEPDVRFDGITIKEPGISVLFKPIKMPVSNPSPEYSSKMLLLHLAALVAKADGVIAEGERSLLLGFIENSSQLNPAEKQRLKANLMWFLNSEAETQGFKKRLESIDQNRKRHLANYLVAVAGADGYISPEEVKMLTKLYKLLDLDTKEVYSDIHLFQVDKKSAADELVTVRPADTGEVGYAIPKPAGKEGFKLDTKKIKDRMKETDEVSTILSDVFEDDVQEEPEEVEIIPEEIEESIHGLDANHSQIVLAFQKQKVWARTEFDKLAAKYGLLPDGALDTLNEKSLEICDEVLCEGEDPIEINQEVLEELTT